MEGLYVDPRTGIVREVKRSKEKNPEVEITLVAQNEDACLFQQVIGGAFDKRSRKWVHKTWLNKDFKPPLKPYILYRKIGAVWYELKHAWHQPGEVYCRSGDEIWPEAVRELGLNSGQKHVIRYKDVPCRNEPRLISKRQCSKKELKRIEENIRKRRGTFGRVKHYNTPEFVRVQ